MRRRRAERLQPERRIDHGWKCRSVCVDGPLANIGLGRSVKDGERVAAWAAVDGTSRKAVYESIGLVEGTPLADGVRLEFVGYENEPCPGRDGKPCSRPPVRRGYCDQHREGA